jgi:hypothetical protein
MEDLMQIELIDNSEDTDYGAISSSDKNFIHANTISITEGDLRNKCHVPSYSKDLESTISHSEFLEAVMYAANGYFNHETILQPAVRCSHEIRGRVPEAIGKPVSLLRPEDLTLFYQRMAFSIELPSLRDSVNGNDLNLSIVGVRSYNLDSLNGKKKEETFKVAIGFVNKVCCNLCIWTTGYKSEIKARSVTEIVQEAYSLFSSYQPELQLRAMRDWNNYHLTERQFAQLVGRSRLYQYLPVIIKRDIPHAIPLMDSQISTVARDFYSDKSFCRNSDGTIALWKLFNLMTGSLKSSYIDTWLDRNAAASTFVGSLQNALKEGSTHWFLS